jgi:hypothetical protein
MTRKFVYSLACFGLLSFAAVSEASDIIGIRVKLGYHFTNSFELKNGNGGSMQGPDIGVDFPMFKFPSIQIYASPSVMLGGKLSHGGDIDGQIYRFMISARQTLTKVGIFGAVGAGVAHSQSRGKNEFRSQNGFLTNITLGVPLKFNFLGITPNFEGSYYFSSQDQFRGFTIGLSASF